jgi:hypothetical protein
MNDVLKKLCVRAEPGRKSRQFLGISSGWGRLLEIEDRIFTERNLRFYGSSLVAAYAVPVLLAWGLNRGEWVIRPDGSLSNIDFCWIWVSRKFAASSDPGRVYDYALFSAAQAPLVGPPSGNIPPYHFLYPPTLLFFTYPLGLISCLNAFSVWVVATLLLYQAAVYAIISRPAALIAAVTPAAVLKNIQLGQNGFLTAALIGCSLAFMERRPWISGIFLGLRTDLQTAVWGALPRSRRRRCRPRH